MLFSLLNDWNYFWNKYCNLPFLAICRSLLPLLIFLASSCIKQPVIKQSPAFLSLSFLIYCCISAFLSFLIKAFANFEKLIRFYWQACIVYKNAENLKILIDIFCPKLLVSNVISAFLDHLKPILFSPANHGDRHRAPPFFKISGSAPSSVQDTKLQSVSESFQNDMKSDPNISLIG